MFHISAIPASGGKAIPGRVLLNESNSDDGFSSHISFSLDLQPDEYEITVKYGGVADQHLLGSPFPLSVAAGPTSPASTECGLTQFVTAGEDLKAKIVPKDVSGAWTNHTSDSFSVWIEGSQSSDKEEAVRHFDAISKLPHYIYSKKITVSGPNCEFFWVCCQQGGLLLSIG